MAVITKGIELYFVKNNIGDNVFKERNKFTEVQGKGVLLPGLMEIGDITGAAGGERDKIEITTLADDKHVYTNGLLAEGENEGIEFKFLYDPDLYYAFTLDSEYDHSSERERSEWALYIPTGTKNDMNQMEYNSFTIKGGSTVKIDGAGVNSAMTMSVTITPVEPIRFNVTAKTAE